MSTFRAEIAGPGRSAGNGPGAAGAVYEAVPERSLQRYTRREDQRILDDWWQPHLRPALLNELGRSKAAVAQRFYFLLRALKITPEEFRHARQQGRRIPPPDLAYSEMSPSESAAGAAPLPETVEPWTPERDAFLVRQVRAGVSFEEIADVLGGVTPAACRSRYYEQVRASSGEADRASEEGDSGGAVLALLRRLPAQQRQMEQQQQELAARVDALAQRLEAISARLDGLAVAEAGASSSRPTGSAAGEGLPTEFHQLVNTIRHYLRLDPWEKVGQLSDFVAQLEKGISSLSTPAPPVG